MTNTGDNASSVDQKPAENQGAGTAVPTQPPQPKMVPEGDLISVKKSLEGKIEKLEAEKSAFQLKADQHYQDLLKERAAMEQLKPFQQKAADAEKSVSDLQAKLDAATTGRKGLETKLLEATKEALTLKYGVAATSLADKTLDQLHVLEDALKLVGAKGSGRTYDLGGAGSSGGDLPVDKIKAGLVELSKKI